ncbi:hypothetical protein APSETT444_008868 [Aspergillus pseudonomiae]
MSAVRFQIPKTEEEWQTAIRDADARDRNGSSGFEPHAAPAFQKYLQSIQDGAPATLRNPDDSIPLGIFEIPRCH